MEKLCVWSQDGISEMYLNKHAFIYLNLCIVGNFEQQSLVRYKSLISPIYDHYVKIVM